MENPQHPPEATSPPVASSGPPRALPFPVVGVGASTGGAAALTTFFRHMPDDCGMAFVVIAPFLAEPEDALTAFLAEQTGMAVRLMSGPTRLAANEILLLPAHDHLTLVDGVLALYGQEPSGATHLPIDHGFRALAEALDGHTAAVILSGTGADGAIGMKGIKEAGGVTLVQDPAEAEEASMPLAAVSTGMVDFVLPVAALPEALLTYWRRGALLPPALGAERGTPGDEAVLQEIFGLLRTRTAHDFSQYKRPTLGRRLRRRMQVTGAPDLTAYLAFVRSQPDELQAFFQDLLISVTTFFRDHEAWATVAAVIPQLFSRKRSEGQVRVWVAACATGEEAYSVAMLLQEFADTLDYPVKIQVFATDIDEHAIAIARRGIYPPTIAGDIPEARLQRFFVPDHGSYRVTQELRELVLFARHNVLHDPPFSQVDLITCRNLLIYLNREAQDYVLQGFHFSLRAAGYMLLGSSETVDGALNLFTTVDKTHRLFQRLPGTVIRPPMGSPSSVRTGPVPRLGSPQGRPAVDDSFEELHQQLLTAYTLPSVLVSEEGDIVHLGRGMGPYLHFGEGRLSSNLLALVHPDLRLDLRTALFTARQRAERTEVVGIRVTLDGMVRVIDLVVQPVLEPDWARGHLLVVLHDLGEVAARVQPSATNADALVTQLESELEHTKFQLRATIEQYEAAVEEYKAANEELQAINEELRAASEEVETSKEELQSVNEELITLNQELKHNVDQLSHTNNDLQNLIGATQIGTIFLDRSLRITRFTPSVQAIFNLIATDLHRPLEHVTHALLDAHLVQDAMEVREMLTTLTREVQTRDGAWYLLRLLPYRTLDNRIDGVVLTFVDITQRKQAEERLQRSEERLRLLIESATDYAILTVTPDNRIDSWSAGAERIFGYRERDIIGQDGACLFTPEDRAQGVPEQEVETALRTGRAVDEREHLCNDGSRVYLSGVTTPLRDRDGRLLGLVKIARDLTAQQAAAEALRASEEQFRRAIEDAPIPVIMHAEDGQVLQISRTWTELTGYSLADVPTFEAWVTRAYGPGAEAVRAHMRDVFVGTRHSLDVGFDLRTRSDELRHWSFSASSPGTLRDGRRFVVGMAVDTTERTRAEVALRAALAAEQAARAETEAALAARDQFFSIASHELRTPLTSLLGSTELLRTSVTEGQPISMRALDRIMRQAQRLERLISQLLDVTRLERGAFALERQSLDLVALTAQVLDEFNSALASGGSAQLLLSLPKQPVRIMGDAQRLEQVLVNLLSNAVKYSPAGGDVRVRVVPTATEAVVEVADAGIGIPAEAQAQLFDPFYRAANVGTQASGFGIGLYVVHEIIQRHGGRITVESQEGVGSTFRVSLPLLAAGRED